MKRTEPAEQIMRWAIALIRHSAVPRALIRRFLTCADDGAAKRATERWRRSSIVDVAMPFVRCGNGGIGHHPVETIWELDAAAAASTSADLAEHFSPGFFPNLTR